MPAPASNSDCMSLGGRSAVGSKPAALLLFDDARTSRFRFSGLRCLHIVVLQTAGIGLERNVCNAAPSMDLSMRKIIGTLAQTDNLRVRASTLNLQLGRPGRTTPRSITLAVPRKRRRWLLQPKTNRSQRSTKKWRSTMRGSQMAVFRRDQPQFRTSGTVQLATDLRAPLWRMRPTTCEASNNPVNSGLDAYSAPPSTASTSTGPSNATKRTHGPSDEQTAQWAIPAGP